MGAAFTEPARGDEPLDFTTKVAPILERYCLRCHSSTVHRGDVVLESPATWTTGTRPIVVPRKPEASRLYQVISGPQPKMPAEGPPLPPDAVETIRRWIAEGARAPDDITLVDRYVPDADWWSYKPLKRPPVPLPTGVAPTRMRTPIDAFLIRKLHEAGLDMSPEADRRTLARRLYFDLLGLPPAPEEVDTFLRDRHPAAYERLVDRLLASPHYGERWARHWLDVAHYADTHGFDKDKVRANAWPYRDYVIRSFNADKPYDQFVLEQIAGDVLRPDDPEAITATGFLVAGPFDWVGQIEVRNGTVEKKRVRNLDRDDMVTTVFNALMSTTVQCARCHNHKFDPVSQDEYYGLQAIFAGIDRADRLVDRTAEIAKRRRALTQQLAKVEQETDRIQARLAKISSPELQRIAERLRAVADNVSPVGKPIEFGYHSAIAPSPTETKWVQVDLGQVRAFELIVLFPCHDDYAGIGAGFGFPVRYRVEVASGSDMTDAALIADLTVEDQPNPGLVPQVFRCPPGTKGRYVRVTATRLAHRSNDYIFALAELAVLDEQGVNLALGASVSARDEVHAPPRWARANLTDGRYIGDWSVGMLAELAKLQARWRALRAKIAPDLRRKLAELKQHADRLRTALSRLPAPMPVFAAATDFKPIGNFVPTKGKPRPVYVLRRGDVRQPIRPAVPQALHCFPWLSGELGLDQTSDEGARRLALARWIAHRDNPLTWRSIVNRIWHWHFGRGIVASVDDFGRMGERPTHPELLDWLAVWFRDDASGSIKRLHRLIVTSAAYRQTSLASAPHAERALRIDAQNTLLWRMNRRRLEAEALRDAALRVADVLDYRLFGPPFRNFHFIDDHSPHYLYDKYNPDVHEPRRRAIYRFVVRSVPDPYMEAFDCPDPAVVTGRRNETLTPLQALVQFNDRFILYVSELWAHRLERTYGTDRAAAVARAGLEAFGRPLDSAELEILSRLSEEHGLAYVCRVLLNANEFVFID